MPLINQGHLFFKSSTNKLILGLIWSGITTMENFVYCN